MFEERYRINEFDKILNKSNFNEGISKYDDILLNSPLILIIDLTNLINF